MSAIRQPVGAPGHGASAVMCGSSLISCCSIHGRGPPSRRMLSKKGRTEASNDMMQYRGHRTHSGVVLSTLPSLVSHFSFLFSHLFSVSSDAVHPGRRLIRCESQGEPRGYTSDKGAGAHAPGLTLIRLRLCWSKHKIGEPAIRWPWLVSTFSFERKVL